MLAFDEKKNGQPIDYTVEETTTIDGYTTVITGNAADGYVVRQSAHT